MKVKVVFDKDKLNENLQGGWGASFLIGENVLFDAGERADYVLKNMNILGIDIGRINTIVISHSHWGHHGGLWDILKIKKDIGVYACPDFIEEFRGRAGSYNFKVAHNFEEIAKDIYTTGCFETLYKGKILYEQALIVRTGQGASLACGCAHVGLLEIIKRVKELFPYLNIPCIFGGFHLMEKDGRFIRYVAEELKKIGVKEVGPSHCSGFEAVSYFKNIFEDNFLEIKVGGEFEI